MTKVRAGAAQAVFKATKRFVFAQVMRMGDVAPRRLTRLIDKGRSAYQSRPKAANVSVMAQQAAACEASRSRIQFNNAVELGRRPFENAERHAFGGIELSRNT